MSMLLKQNKEGRWEISVKKTGKILHVIGNRTEALAVKSEIDDKISTILENGIDNYVLPPLKQLETPATYVPEADVNRIIIISKNANYTITDMNNVFEEIENMRKEISDLIVFEISKAFEIEMRPSLAERSIDDVGQRDKGIAEEV